MCETEVKPVFPATIEAMFSDAESPMAVINPIPVTNTLVVISGLMLLDMLRDGFYGIQDFLAGFRIFNLNPVYPVQNDNQ